MKERDEKDVMGLLVTGQELKILTLFQKSI
jgi:hypothetical protein